MSAPDFKTVQLEVSKLLRGKILVGHALKNDLAVSCFINKIIVKKLKKKMKFYRLNGDLLQNT